jgi:MYXO-CTERM domain-containing protein
MSSAARRARARGGRPGPGPGSAASDGPATGIEGGTGSTAADGIGLRRTGRRTGLLAAAVLVLGGFCALGAGTAHADGYRYWSFWERDGGQWVYATQGPATSRPADGDVQGFRFSVSEDSRNAAKPRGAADFDAICAGTPARPGTKHLALVLDFGTAAHALGGETPPKSRTECARVPEDATSAEALAAVAQPLRYDSSALLCAIAGYPEKGCAEQVDDRGAAPKAEPSADDGTPSADSSTGPSAGLFAGLAAVLVLGAAALWRSRRRG